jgi:hypothetical protein
VDVSVVQPGHHAEPTQVDPPRAARRSLDDAPARDGEPARRRSARGQRVHGPSLERQRLVIHAP